jgi:hypothetical protein
VVANSLFFPAARKLMQIFFGTNEGDAVFSEVIRGTGPIESPYFIGLF